MKLRYELVLRNVAGETILVPIGEAAKKYSGLFAVNELGAFLWERIPEAESEAALVNLVLEDYEVSREEAEQDVQEFLGKLREMDLLD